MKTLELKRGKYGWIAYIGGMALGFGPYECGRFARAVAVRSAFNRIS
jgi:hypothetical protein